MAAIEGIDKVTFHSVSYDNERSIEAKSLGTSLWLCMEDDDCTVTYFFGGPEEMEKLRDEMNDVLNEFGGEPDAESRKQDGDVEGVRSEKTRT